jgi:transcriptional regulator with XRE-family HTH domain
MADKMAEKPVDEYLSHYLKICAQNVFHFRERHGMTQKQLGKKAGVGLSTVQNAENGENVSSKKLLCICRALNIRPDQLFISEKQRDLISGLHLEAFLPLVDKLKE